MDVTVVVVPRERFTSLPASLRSLFATIDSSVPVVVVEGDSPQSVHEELNDLRSERDFEVISTERMLLPNEARNVGAAAAKSKYIVFADNDIHYSPNWLEPLVAAAEKTGADTVAPLILIGPSSEPKIHHAGGYLKVGSNQGRKTIGEVHRLSNVHVKDADFTKDAPPYNEVCEFHCVLIRRDFLDRIGGLDETYVSREHIELALLLRNAGGKSVFCLDSVVSYTAMSRFAWQDLKYMCFRWHDKIAANGISNFEKKWDADANSLKLRQGPIRGRRHRAILSCFGITPRSRFYKQKAAWVPPLVERYFDIRCGNAIKKSSGERHVS